MLAQAAHHAPSTSVTVFFAVLLASLIACLAFEEKIHAKKSVITSSFAVVFLLLGSAIGILPFGQITLPNGHLVHLPVFIPSVEWDVIAMVLGTGIFVEVTAKSGLYNFIALKITRASKGDPNRLLWLYGIMTVVFSAVLNNVTAMVIVGSLTVVSLEKLGRRDFLLGFLLIEGLLTNIGGLLTLISSIPNIIVGQTAGIGFVDFFVVASPYVLVATIATIFIGARQFGIEKIKSNEEKKEAADLVDAFLPEDAIENPALFKISGFMLLMLILAFSCASLVPILDHLGLGFVALAFGAMVLWAEKHTADRIYTAIDWDLIGFFACLFICINVAEHAGVLNVLGDGIGKLLELGDRVGASALLVSSAVASSVTDNVPLAAVLSKVLQAQSIPADSPHWWAVIFGANLGGNLTPIGSASTLVAVTIANRQKLKLSFGKFFSLAIKSASVQIVLAILYLLLL